MKKIFSLLSVFSSIMMAITPATNLTKNMETKVDQINATTPLDFQTSIQKTNNILDDNMFAGHYSHRSHSSHYSHRSHSSHYSSRY